MLLREIIRQVPLVRELADIMIAPLRRASNVVKAVAGNNADRVLIYIIVLDGKGDDVFRFVVFIKILSVRPFDFNPKIVPRS